MLELITFDHFSPSHQIWERKEPKRHYLLTSFMRKILGERHWHVSETNTSCTEQQRLRKENTSYVKHTRISELTVWFCADTLEFNNPRKQPPAQITCNCKEHQTEIGHLTSTWGAPSTFQGQTSRTGPQQSIRGHYKRNVGPWPSPACIFCNS